MRKSLSISLLFLYLIASAGFTVTAHYCGGNLAELALFEKTTCCCDKEEETPADDCCKDEIKQFKISDEQLKTEQQITPFPSTEMEPPLPTVFHHGSDAVIFPASLTATPLPDAPDRSNLLPPYKRNHSFLFYS